MVPVYFLLLALPLAQCGMLPDAAQMSAYLALMKQMEEIKGWGPTNPPMTAAPTMSMQTKEEYEAYMKWCADNQKQKEEQAKKQELLDAWKAREAKHKAEMEKAKEMQEAKEREELQMAQWKMWEHQMEMSGQFDTISRTVADLKGKYHYTVTMEFFKFCKCSDFTAEVGRYFNHEELYKYEEFDIDDLGMDAVRGQDPAVVAGKLNQLSEVDRIKMFFGGLANAMCDGAKSYIEDVQEWEKTYNFLDKLS